RPPWRRSRRSSLASGRSLLTGFGEEDPIVGRIRGRPRAWSRGHCAGAARREALPHSLGRVGALSFAHLGADAAAGLAVGLALRLGFLLGAAEVFASPSVESVIAASHAAIPVGARREK